MYTSSYPSMNRPGVFARQLHDGDPHVEVQMPPNVERLVDYQLGIDASQISDDAADRLGDGWAVQRDRWLEHDLGLYTTIALGKRRNHLVVYDNDMNRVAKIPAGLSPSVERRWLLASSGVQNHMQSVDDRFDEVTQVFAPVIQEVQPQNEKEGFLRSMLGRFSIRERDSTNEAPGRSRRVMRIAAGVAALAIAGLGGVTASEHADVPAKKTTVTISHGKKTTPVSNTPHEGTALPHEHRIVNDTDVIVIKDGHASVMLKSGGNPWNAARDMLQAEGVNSDNAAIAQELSLSNISSQSARKLPIGTVLNFN